MGEYVLWVYVVVGSNPTSGRWTFLIFFELSSFGKSFEDAYEYIWFLFATVTTENRRGWQFRGVKTRNLIARLTNGVGWLELWL